MKILFATDGSAHSQAAIELLNRIPFPPGSELTLLSVLELPPPLFIGETQNEAAQPLREETEASLASECQRFENPGLSVSAMTRVGHAADTIVSVAQELNADLVVVGSHGRGAVGRFLLGSVSQSVVKHAHCSVLVARQPNEHTTETNDKAVDRARLQVLLAFDNSVGADNAVKTIESLPIGEAADIAVVTVMTVVKYYRMDIVERMSEFWQEEKREAETALAATSKRLKQAIPNVSTQLVEGESVSGAVLDKAKESDADLIIMGHKGKSAIDRFLLGSVSNDVVHHAPCSVWIVR